MAIAQVNTIQPAITTGALVTIETDISRGLHSFSIVGLAGKAVDESKDRISSAIKHSGFSSPKSKNHKITVSLAPADLKKDGPLFDLPIAIAYLIAAEEITVDNTKRIYVGELGLDGTLKPIKGVLNSAITAVQAGFTEIIVPAENALEAALIENIIIRPARNLREVINHISTETGSSKLPPQPITVLDKNWHDADIRLEDIKGQESAKRGLIIAAAGRHNVMLVGPPGTGKTMLARALATLLPPLSRKEALEVTTIHSLISDRYATNSRPPFRSPHHTASHTSLVGGGAIPRPGEVTLAHHGVLFMDEFPEFERRSLDALRQPLEDRVVSISRVQGSAEFPADFILVAALNPYRQAEDGTTNLARAMSETYKNKISGPIIDRIDLWLEVLHVDYHTLTEKTSQTNKAETQEAREQILLARNLQSARFENTKTNTNAGMTARDIETYLHLNEEVKDLLKVSSEKLNLSPRSYHRVLKVARTIADLDNSEEIKVTHVLEALQYRITI